MNGASVQTLRAESVAPLAHPTRCCRQYPAVQQHRTIWTGPSEPNQEKLAIDAKDNRTSKIVHQDDQRMPLGNDVMLCCVVLCCVVLRCVALCCVVLCCVVLCCVVLCCVVLFCVVLCCVVLCCVVLCCVVLCSAALCCAVLCCAVLCRVVLCRVVSCRVVLCSAVLCCAVLCCVVPKALLPEGNGRDVYPRVQVNGRAVCLSARSVLVCCCTAGTSAQLHWAGAALPTPVHGHTGSSGPTAPCVRRCTMGTLCVVLHCLVLCTTLYCVCPATLLHCTCGQWAMEASQCTAILPVGRGQ